MLKCELNTPEMAGRILLAFFAMIGDDGNVEVDFEHGQWWVTDKRPEVENESGSWPIYSVHDAEGPSSIDGFGFERIA